MDTIGFKAKEPFPRKELTYEWLMQEYRIFVSRSVLSVEEMRLKYEFHYLFKSHYFQVRSVVNKVAYCRLVGNGMDSLLHFLKYIIGGVLDSNLADVQSWMKKYQIENQGSFSYTKIEELGIEIMRLKNQDVRIKGLTEAHIASINYISGLFDHV